MGPDEALHLKESLVSGLFDDIIRIHSDDVNSQEPALEKYGMKMLGSYVRTAQQRFYDTFYYISVPRAAGMWQHCVRASSAGLLSYISIASP